MIIVKLAAILGVANVLDRDQTEKAVDLKISSKGDQIVLTGQNVSDLTMGRLALASRSDCFTEIFGKQIILKEAGRTQ